MISNEKWPIINEIIYKIYSADHHTDLRQSFLAEFHKIIPHNFAFFDLWRFENGEYIWFDPISLTMDDDLLNDYYENYVKLDYVAQIGSDMNEAVVLRNSDILTTYTRSHSAIYTNYFSRAEGHFVCGTFIRHGSVPYATICFGRKEELGDFTDEEVEIMYVLIKHLGLRFHQFETVSFAVPAQSPVLPADLSAREKEITELLLAGATSEEISKKLFISSGTARKHISNIYRKMHVTNRTQLVIKLFEKD